MAVRIHERLRVPHTRRHSGREGERQKGRGGRVVKKDASVDYRHGPVESTCTHTHTLMEREGGRGGTKEKVLIQVHGPIHARTHARRPRITSERSTAARVCVCGLGSVPARRLSKTKPRDGRGRGGGKTSPRYITKEFKAQHHRTLLVVASIEYSTRRTWEVADSEEEEGRVRTGWHHMHRDRGVLKLLCCALSAEEGCSNNRIERDDDDDDRVSMGGRTIRRWTRAGGREV